MSPITFDARALGVTAALASAASWALGSILFKRLGSAVPSSAMTLFKGGLSVVLLTLAVLLTGFDGLAIRPLLLLIGSGLLGIGLGDTFFFEALKHLGAHALVVLMMLGQVLTALLAAVLLGEMPTPVGWTGIALVIAGVGLVVWEPQRADAPFSSPRGLAFGAAAVACMAVSLIIAKLGLDDLSALHATWIRMIAGTVGVLGLGLQQGNLRRWAEPFLEPAFFGRFLAAVAVVTFGGFWLSLVALKHLNVAVANTLNSTEPVFVLPLAAIFLKERITARSLVGTGVTMVGIALLSAA